MSEVTSFAVLERQDHANAFINQLSADDHRALFEAAEVVYFTILSDVDAIAGYFIIALEGDGHTAEFRRIVVDK